MNIKTNCGHHAEQSARRVATYAVCALAVAAQAAVPAYAGSYEQAVRIYERIAGVAPSAADLQTMVPMTTAGQYEEAATYVTDNAPTFYSVTLKNMVIPWTNRDQTVFEPLNDYAATVIGMVRDNVPFNTALSADILYTINASGLPAPSPANNNHYATAEANGVDLRQALVKTSQSAVYGTPTAATAGLLTTRAAAAAFFVAGTNRAMFRYTMLNHLCNDMQTLMDTSRPTDRIRQDVSRSPGGDSRIFLNNCAGCHTGMDPMAQAFAYYDFDATSGRMTYTSGSVQPKYLINSANFQPGYITTDDHWENRWRNGPNQALGWDPGRPGSGAGAKSLGDEIANSDAFATCQVVKVFQTVCFRQPTTDDKAQLDGVKAQFKAGGYSLKQVFQKTAAICPGN